MTHHTMNRHSAKEPHITLYPYPYPNPARQSYMSIHTSMLLASSIPQVPECTAVVEEPVLALRNTDAPPVRSYNTQHACLYLRNTNIYNVHFTINLTQMFLREREMFYLTTHSTRYLQLYGVRTTQIVRKETRCHHIGYSF